MWQDPTTPENQYYVDVAASLQAVLEEAELGLVRNLQRTTGETALDRRWRRPEQLVQRQGPPSGSSIQGRLCAARCERRRHFAWRRLLHPPSTARQPAQVRHERGRDHGPAFGDTAISQVLDRSGLTYVRLDEDQLARLVARMIEQGNVVGWFQDRMEWGPARWATAAFWRTHVATT